MTTPRMSPSRFARLHNEDLRPSDELSFDMPEKPSVLSEVRTMGYFTNQREAFQKYLVNRAEWHGRMARAMKGRGF